jgi:hypothetical protein
MYSLLTPIRYVLNPRFELTTPLQSGLFYIAPGCGYLTGTFFGGRWADHVVKKWIRKRGGQRVPEDRLRSCLVALGVVIPACMVLYGWSIEKEVGGIPLPVIVMYIQGVAQLFCFPSLNTYCLVSCKKQPESHERKRFSLTSNTGRNEEAILRSRSRQLRDQISVRCCRISRLSSCHREDRRGLVFDNLCFVPCCCDTGDLGDCCLGPRVAGGHGEAVAV